MPGQSKLLLAGDVGGTKTTLAVFSPKTGPRMALAEATFPSARYATLEMLPREFLARVDVPIGAACLGMAGPVVSGRAEITNLSWVIDAERLRGELGASSVRLVNDAEALAHAVPVLEPAELLPLNVGQRTPTGAIAVIAPGTGLGEGFLVWDGTRYRAHSSEGGHADFGPTDATQIELLRYLSDRFEHVSYERVCSGLGLPHIYAFFRDRHGAGEPPWLAERLATSADPTPVIVEAALAREGSSELCALALDMFVSILGAEAGNLALKVLAMGGVYLGGGIPPRILPALKSGQFVRAFAAKGRFTRLLAGIPVQVILNPRAALPGAASTGLAEA